MDFLANGQQQKKNPTGIAVVVLLHVAAVAIALQNSTVTLTRSLPSVIDVLTEPPAPQPEPEPPKLLAEPQLQPPPTIAVPQVEVQDLAPPVDTPVLSTRTVSETPPPSIAGGNAGAGAATEPAPRAAPVRTAAIVDARACKRPDYPRNALRNGETGTVTLALLIGTDGKVVESKVEGSSGSRELDRAAQAGLSLCRFQPGTVDGVPQQSWTRMQYVWNLDD